MDPETPRVWRTRCAETSTWVSFVWSAHLSAVPRCHYVAVIVSYHIMCCGHTCRNRRTNPVGDPGPCDHAPWQSTAA